MIVRRTDLRAFIDVAKNAEMEIRVLIEDPPFDLHIRTEMLRYECLISAGLFCALAD
jgi:hypothetical protein